MIWEAEEPSTYSQTHVFQKDVMHVLASATRARYTNCFCVLEGSGITQRLSPPRQKRDPMHVAE